MCINGATAQSCCSRRSHERRVGLAGRRRLANTAEWRKGAGRCTQHMPPSAGSLPHDPITATSCAGGRPAKGGSVVTEERGETGRCDHSGDRVDRGTQQVLVVPSLMERTNRKCGRGHLEAVKRHAYGAVQAWKTYARKQKSLYVIMTRPECPCCLRPGRRSNRIVRKRGGSLGRARGRGHDKTRQCTQR